MDTGARRATRFDDWKLLHAPLELFYENTRVRVQEQPLIVLEALLAQPGALVKREDLIARLWPRAVTDYEAGLHTAVRKLRSVLKDDADSPRYIETVPRQGYRFIGSSVGTATVEPRAADRPAAAKVIRVAGALAAALLVATGAWWIRSASNQSEARQTAHELWLSGVIAWHNIGGGGSTAEEMDRVEGIFTRAIEQDPGLAQAYADRARIRITRFVIGNDTSDSNLQAARSDLRRARELAGTQAFLLVREAQLACLVDGDLSRALDLLRQAEALAPLDADQLMTKANFLAYAGRIEDSLTVYPQAARLDPGNPAIYRYWMITLLSVNRPSEAMQVVRQFDARLPGRIARGEWLFGYTGDPQRWRVEVEATSRVGKLPNALSNEFDLLRMEGRSDALRALVSNAGAALFVPHHMGGNIIGAVPRPASELRGWERLLAGDAAGAREAGLELEQFLERQSERDWNAWSLRLLEAEAAVMTRDVVRARERIRLALLALPPPRNFSVHIYPRMMAARVLAWSGATGEAVDLLEKLATEPPVVGPAAISRDPLLSIPLAQDARWRALRMRLDSRVLAPEKLGS